MSIKIYTAKTMGEVGIIRKRFGLDPDRDDEEVQEEILGEGSILGFVIADNGEYNGYDRLEWLKENTPYSRYQIVRISGKKKDLLALNR